jgi:hypothetical protein
LTKQSRYERSQRTAEQTRIREIEATWAARISPEQAASFKREVEVALARTPEPRQDMAPGTLPNPPRPGREPRPPKEQAKGRSRY